LRIFCALHNGQAMCGQIEQYRYRNRLQAQPFRRCNALKSFELQAVCTMARNLKREHHTRSAQRNKKR